jgi:hypothetical protein
VVEITGVVKDVPLPRLVPQVADGNQFNVEPILAVAPNVTVPEPQRVAGVVEVIDGSLTVTVATVDSEHVAAPSFTAIL